MAKRKREVRRTKPTRRKTNWLLIGGIVAAAIIFVALVALAFREPDAADVSLATYCEENPGSCISRGQSDAPVEIVEVSDYGCGVCQSFNLQTADLVTDLVVTPGDAQWTVMPYALGSQTLLPAEGALCANEQEHFFDYHRRMFQLQGTPGLFEQEGLTSVAEELGLDAATFESCLATGKYTNTIQNNLRAASRAGVRGTPTFFVNDDIFRGNRDLTFFQQQVSQIINSSDAN